MRPAPDRMQAGSVLRRRLGACAVVLAAALALLVPTAGAQELDLAVSGSGPGPVTVEGTGVDGSGVWLFQCWDTPEGEEMFWQVCDTSTGVQVLDDTPWSVTFPTQAVIRTREGFGSGTENSMGNGTTDCEAADAHCGVAATSDWQSFAWAQIPFNEFYGPLEQADLVGDRTDLIDGEARAISSTGHRPSTQAMAYICAGYGYAFPGSCDPIPASEATIPPDGTYTRSVSLPRFVWVNDPFDNADWFDCAAGCSVVVSSADNLSTPYWEPGSDQLLVFRAVPLEQQPDLLTVKRVLVNRLGGITVEGRIDCTAAIQAWGQDGSLAGVNIDWTARQPLGRRGAVTARYQSAIATICHDPHNENPLLPPYPWYTHPPITDPSIWWVYPDAGGKFAAGPIHLDVRATGGSWGNSPGSEQYILTGATQWDGKAVKG